LTGATLHPEHVFSFEAHPNNTTREHLETLYRAGFRRLSLGVQDFDPSVQDIINRIQTYEVTKEVVDMARETGYQSVNFDLIYGLPLQTLNSVTDTIHKSITIKPDRISFYSYAHVPWYKPAQRKYTEADLPKDEEKRMLYEAGKQLFLDEGYSEIGMDHFALSTDSLSEAERSHKLHRNFMGYTENHTQLLIGLGCSSISDSWYGFAQNEKKVEDYESRVSRGEFPIIRGHILNAEDLLLRKHILNMMCEGHTSFAKEPIGPELKEEVVERLKPLQADNLIQLSADDIRVTETGKAFLRNICMAFDARLWRIAPGSEMFSSAV
jgi:oxygen-independent coproporphyrinogen III oxidase